MAQVKVKKSTPKKSKSKGKVHTYLEKLVSKTQKFKVEDLLDLYKVYDKLVIEYVFRLLLFPHARFARTWLRDQARDLLAGTDRNRLILTSRSRKSTEAQFETLNADDRKAWSQSIKPRHSRFIVEVLRLLHHFDTHGTAPDLTAIRDLGVSRLVFDDLGSYFVALMNSYPTLTADWLSAKAAGDHEEAALIDVQLRALETEVGIRRDDAWYVTVNARSIYDQIEKMVQTVTMAYARLLFRFAHRLRGVTSTEENFSAGYEGMIRAARNYDPIDGSSFTAHCQWWVRSAVLQRQRQSSVILLPTTTWYQLSLLQRGEVELSKERISDLKERAEMFYANSANASKSSQDVEDHDDFSFESVRVTSPDAGVVLGDALPRSQAVEENYESHDISHVGRGIIEESVGLLHEEDPSLLFPVLLWALNSGIDATMLAEVVSPLFLSEDQQHTEKIKHQSSKAALIKRTNLNQRTTETKQNGKVTPSSSKVFQQHPLG
jgi:hypothetical protein